MPLESVHALYHGGSDGRGSWFLNRARASETILLRLGLSIHNLVGGCLPGCGDTTMSTMTLLNFAEFYIHVVTCIER